MPIEDGLDCGHSGNITTQDITAHGKSIFKVVILTHELIAGKAHMRVCDDCQGWEVGHLFYGVLPHPTGQGRSMGTKNLPDNVAFIKRLFNRDTCANGILHIQQGHAAAISKLSTQGMTADKAT